MKVGKSILSLEQEKLATPSLETCPEDSISSVEEVAPCLCSVFLLPRIYFPKMQDENQHLFWPETGKNNTHTHTQKTCNFFSVIFSHHFFHPKTGAKSQLRKVGNQSSNFPSSPSSPSSRARSFTTACHEGVEVFTHDENPPKQGLSMKIYGKFIGNSLHFPHETPHLLGWKDSWW